MIPCHWRDRERWSWKVKLFPSKSVFLPTLPSVWQHLLPLPPPRPSKSLVKYHASFSWLEGEFPGGTGTRWAVKPHRSLRRLKNLSNWMFTVFRLPCKWTFFFPWMTKSFYIKINQQKITNNLFKFTTHLPLITKYRLSDQRIPLLICQPQHNKVRLAQIGSW